MHRFKVAKMSCGHCASAITRAVKGVDPQAEVSVDLARREVTVDSGAEEILIAGAIRSAGYEHQTLAA